MKLQELQLDEKTTATTFISDFIICSQKLEKRNEGDTAETKRHKFLDKITDDNYDVVIQQLKGETSLTFDQCVLRVRTREQELESSANKATKAKSRRTKT
jgi:aminopeptidase-like protein